MKTTVFHVLISIAYCKKKAVEKCVKINSHFGSEDSLVVLLGWHTRATGDGCWDIARSLNDP
jgi:hypothetical protein